MSNLNAYIDDSNVEQWQTIADECDIPMDDIYWFESWCPEALHIIENYWRNPYENAVERFGTWEDWLDFCCFYDLEPDTQEEYMVFDDAGLSCVYAFA